MGLNIYDPPGPPPHLTASAAQWWRTVLDRFVLEEHHLRLLQLACEAWDRGQKARAQIDAEGLTVAGREGVKPHPCIAIERDARLAVARLVRELDLDVQPPISERVGPAALLSNGRSRRAG
jgi:phage terminase small subunit